jgi:hypothetical protein
MRLDSKAPKPEEARCPLCGKVRPIRIAMPLTATNTYVRDRPGPYPMLIMSYDSPQGRCDGCQHPYG